MAWHIVSSTDDLTLTYEVPCFEDVAQTHKRLLADDPVWQKPRIRTALASRIHSRSKFWDALQVSKK